MLTRLGKHLFLRNRLPGPRMLLSVLVGFGLISTAVSAEHSHQAPISLEITAEERQYLAELATLRICTETNWLPYEHVDNAGNYQGILADYADLIVRRLGLSYQRHLSRDYRHSLKALQAGDCDLIVAEVATPEKLQYSLATKPYFIAPRAFAVHSDRPYVADFASLSNEPVGVLHQSPAQFLLPQIYPGIEVRPFSSTDLGIQKVANGEIGSFVNILGALTYSIQTQGLSNVKIGGALPGNIPLSMLVNPAHPQLVPLLNAAIDSITPQEQQQIFNQWISVRVEKGFDWPFFWSILGTVTLLASFIIINYMRWNRRLKREIERRKLAEQEVRRLAMTDSLTDLASRSCFFQRIREVISLADRQQTQLGLLWLDLDKFKPVNDSYGHPVGDEVLRILAGRLAETCRESDLVARVGGDEFAILVLAPEQEEALIQVAERLIEALSQPIELGDKRVEVGGSIGIAIYPEHGISSTMLIENADKALYEAKRMGGNRFRIYNPSTATISRPLDMLTEDD